MKLFSFNSENQESINERKRGLEKYLKQIIQIPQVRKCKLFQSFIQPDRIIESSPKEEIKLNSSLPLNTDIIDNGIYKYNI